MLFFYRTGPHHSRTQGKKDAAAQLSQLLSALQWKLSSPISPMQDMAAWRKSIQSAWQAIRKIANGLWPRRGGKKQVAKRSEFSSSAFPPFFP